MMQHSNSIQRTLEESQAQAGTGAFLHIRKIFSLTEQFARWVSLNPSMKDKVRSEITEPEQLEYKTHMTAMQLAMIRSQGSADEDNLNLAASIERLKALNVLTGAAMRAFPQKFLAALTPEELEEPQYLAEIRNLGLDNMADLAVLKP